MREVRKRKANDVDIILIISAFCHSNKKTIDVRCQSHILIKSNILSRLYQNTIDLHCREWEEQGVKTSIFEKRGFPG